MKRLVFFKVNRTGKFHKGILNNMGTVQPFCKYGVRGNTDAVDIRTVTTDYQFRNVCSCCSVRDLA